MKTYNRAGKLLRILGVNDPLWLYETSHDHCNSSVYSFRVEVSRANSRYILDIEFFNYIYWQTKSSEGPISKFHNFSAKITALYVIAPNLKFVSWSQIN